MTLCRINWNSRSPRFRVQRKSHLLVAPSRWVRCDLAGAEHVTAIAHVIVRHEQLTGKGLEVT